MRGAACGTIVVAMTETTHEDPPPPLPPPGSVPPQRGAPPLVRDPDDAVVAGVCAAFGRSTDTDPVLWRVTVAVLALFGGAGLVLYALGWLLIPRRGERHSFAERTLRRPDRGISPAGVLLVIAAAVVLLAVLDDGPGFGALLVVAGIAYLVLRERRDPRPGAAVPPGPYAGSVPSYDGPTPSFGTGPYAGPYAGPYGPDGDVDADAAYGTAAYGPAPYGTAPYGPAPYGPAPYGTDPYAPSASLGDPWGTAPAPVPRRPRSPLAGLTLSAAALLAGVLLALRLAAGIDALTPERIVAVVLLVVGLGLLVGAFVGRARLLIPVGLVLAVVLAGTAGARGAGLGDGVGARTWTPVDGGTYTLGAGEAVLDLRALDADADLAADVGAGTLTVLVPRGTRAVVDAEVGVGEISRSLEGGRRTVLTPDDDEGLSEQFVVGSGDVRVALDLEVGLGRIEVRRVAA